MRVVLSLLAGLSITIMGTCVWAQSQEASPVVVTPTPAVEAPTVTPAITPAPVAEAPAATPAPAPIAPVETTAAPAQAAPPSPPQPVIATLKDGSKIEMEADGSVQAINNDGSKTPVPDGLLTLRDNATFSVRGGKRVDE